ELDPLLERAKAVDKDEVTDARNKAAKTSETIRKKLKWTRTRVSDHTPEERIEFWRGEDKVAIPALTKQVVAAEGLLPALVEIQAEIGGLAVRAGAVNQAEVDQTFTKVSRLHDALVASVAWIDKAPEKENPGDETLCTPREEVKWYQGDDDTALPALQATIGAMEELQPQMVQVTGQITDLQQRADTMVASDPGSLKSLLTCADAGVDRIKETISAVLPDTGDNDEVQSTEETASE
ncbi:hypothetical protein CL634_03345, partial [bacterium]|nr:hypothetical protein [bacterium]